MESRIKMLREKRGLIQELLAVEIGVTQQMLSKYEKDITIIKVDVLKRIAEYFNVTTDYLLGLSDMKRDLSGQIKMNETNGMVDHADCWKNCREKKAGCGK